MSRAFVKDDDDRPEPAILSARAPYYVIESALAQLDDEKRERAEVFESVPGVAGFGSRVAVRDDGGTQTIYTIVNDEDADPAAGAIGITSPLVRALIGSRVGASVVWRRPVGDLTLVVERIDDPL